MNINNSYWKTIIFDSYCPLTFITQAYSKKILQTYLKH